MQHEKDVITLGAHCLSTRDLLRLAGVDKSEVEQAEVALTLLGPARLKALRDLQRGPALIAALELGRRAWMLPSPAGRRVRAPVDVAAICAPRMSDEEPECIAIALDRRLSVARVEVSAVETAAILRVALGAETTRVIVALNRRGQRAVPDLGDSTLAEQLTAAAAAVRVSLIDIVLLGDDGFCSLLRLGLLSAADPRYR